MHRLAVEFSPVRRRSFTSRRETATITLVHIEMVIHVAVETIGPVEPGPRAYKYAAWKPVRPIVSVRRASVWRRLVVSVRTDRSHAEADRNVPRSASNHEQAAQPQETDAQIHESHNR